jgi:hypothetical protein
LSKKRGRRARPAPVSLGAEAMEDLPYPYVYYPNHYGTFFAFAKDETSPPSLCACFRDPVENLWALRQISPPGQNSNPLRMAPLDSMYFPDVIAESAIAANRNPLDEITYKEGLCHRCNMATPTLRYCHEMYGTKFIQHFGWYVNQQYLRLGIMPMSLTYLPEVCPPEIQEEIRRAIDSGAKFHEEQQRLVEIASGPARSDINPNEVTYWRNVREDEAARMISLRRVSGRATRTVTKRIENMAREEFGFRKVGEAWISETLLFQLVTKVLGRHKVVRHHRPDWLEGMELDIYVPSLKLGFEYQGQQHFHSIEAWGGEDGLKQRKERDRKKKAICREQGITLIEYHYTEPLTEENVRMRLREARVDYD